MSTGVSVHAISGMEIVMEIPDNGHCIEIREIGQKTTVTFYLPIDQWFALRQAFPKAAGYSLHLVNTRDVYSLHSAADFHAREYYEKNRSQPQPPEPNAQTDAPGEGSVPELQSQELPPEGPVMLPVIEEDEEII